MIFVTVMVSHPSASDVGEITTASEQQQDQRDAMKREMAQLKVWHVSCDDL